MFDRLIAALPNYSVLLIEAQTDTGPPNHRSIPKSYDKHLDSAFRWAIQKSITVVYGGRGFGADAHSVYEEGLYIPIMKFADKGEGITLSSGEVVACGQLVNAAGNPIVE